MPNISEENRDSASPVWDMSQERQLTEMLMAQRFNFFLVFFSIVVAGSINAKVQFHLQLVLTAGALVSMILVKALFRTSERLNAILEYLKRDPTHPYTIISAAVGGHGVRKLLWRHLPAGCTAALATAALLSWFCVIRVPSVTG